MADDDRELPTTNQPLHGKRRPRVGPALAVLGLFVVLLLIFGTYTWLRYNT